jgi:Ca2+:H+ antiporter
MKIGPLNVDFLGFMLVLVPVALAVKLGHAPPLWIFISSAAAIMPLAGYMGRATEHLAERTGPGIGGLLNATFGNAAELIIALVALSKGLDEVVKASITGSIIGNILLVLGLSFLAGGLRHSTQVFNRTAAGVGATLLVLSTIGLVIPALFDMVAPPGVAEDRLQPLSMAIAGVLLVTYGLSLVFSLHTHKHLYASANQEMTADDEAADPAAEGDHWSVKKSVIVLLAATVGVALMSEFLVSAIEHSADALGGELFVGVIVVAIIGNAAEHSTAILVALKNKMDLSLNIAVGSSAQIALFVAPVLVFAGAIMGQPMDLRFSNFEVIAVALSVWAVCQISDDGESNWLEGAMLLAVYAILALAFFFLSVAGQH